MRICSVVVVRTFTVVDSCVSQHLQHRMYRTCPKMEQEECPTKLVGTGVDSEVFPRPTDVEVMRDAFRQQPVMVLLTSCERGLILWGRKYFALLCHLLHGRGGARHRCI